MSGKLRWGILGTGWMAGTMAHAMKQSSTAMLWAVASRSQAAADAFGRPLQVPPSQCYQGYEQLLADPQVQAVYLALPNHLHAPWAIAAAKAGKHVLCEKPLALNHAEAVAVVRAAQDAGTFLMEAYMYRSHPQMDRLIDILHSGVLGEVRMIEASFGFNRSLQGDYRSVLAMGGGSILDVGGYVMSAARLVAGVAMGGRIAEPVDLRAVARLHPVSGIDEYSAAVATFRQGDHTIVAYLAASMQVNLPLLLAVYGSKGEVRIESPWFPHQDGFRFLLRREGMQGFEEVLLDRSKSAYAYELDMVARYLQRGEANFPCPTLEDTLGNMAALDRWRAAAGVILPQDVKG